MGQTDEGSKRPVTRRSRLLVVRCARCSRCGVSSHRKNCLFVCIFTSHVTHTIHTDTATFIHSFIHFISQNTSYIKTIKK